jgi:lysozyme family protein
MYMAVFEVALAYLLSNEGSAYTADPLDRGGPTRYGITQAALSNYLGRPASVLDVQGIDHVTVAAIYRSRYWTPICGDQIQNQAIANAFLDLAALTGPTQAARMMQTAAGVTSDGLVGPRTLAAINAAASQTLLVSFSHKACAYFAAIALRDPTQAKFLSGWQLRAHKMLLPSAL